MVAVDILTGYLGAGKTTLLRHALQHGLRDRRVAVVVNELGAVGVDGTVLAGPTGDPSVLELADGCLCCAVDAPHFDRAVVDLVARSRADFLVVEASGVADPQALVRRLRPLGFGIDAITTVVDASDVERRVREDPVVARQIKAADFVVLTKTDLVPADTARRVRAFVGALNPRAHRLVGEHGRVDPTLLFATGVARARRPATGPAVGSDVQAVVVPVDAAVDLDAFEELLAAMPSDVVRAKGIVRIAGVDTHCVFNYASGRYELSWLRLPVDVPTQAVFLGRDVRRATGRLTAALACCQSGGGVAVNQ